MYSLKLDYAADTVVITLSDENGPKIRYNNVEGRVKRGSQAPETGVNVPEELAMDLGGYVVGESMGWPKPDGARRRFLKRRQFRHRRGARGLLDPRVDTGEEIDNT